MYTIGQLSKKTDVTVRTLDYYDEINLLSPSSKTDGGHRLYAENDVLRLQQISAMKYMGFSLEEIKEKLDDGTTNWQQSVVQQLEMVEYQKKRLQRLEQALQGVLQSIQLEGELNWQIIFEIIYLFQNDTDITRWLYDHNLNKEEQKFIMEIYDNRNQKDKQKWVRLIQEVRTMLEEGQEPGSKEAQQLAEQWMIQVDKMFEGKQYLQGKMWDIIKNHSDDVAFYPLNRNVVQFMELAVDIMHSRQEDTNG